MSNFDTRVMKNRRFRLSQITTMMLLLSASAVSADQSTYSYTIVDTNQSQCSDTSNTLDTCIAPGESGFGQDAQYQGNSASYSVNPNGTITDNNTGLIWAQSIDINGDGQITAADKVTYDQAISSG